MRWPCVFLVCRTRLRYLFHSRADGAGPPNQVGRMGKQGYAGHMQGLWRDPPEDSRDQPLPLLVLLWPLDLLCGPDFLGGASI